MHTFYLCQMDLNLMLGFNLFLYFVCKGVVHGIPIVKHQVRGMYQQLFYSVAHVLRSLPFTLRSLDVVIAEFGPSLRNRVTINMPMVNAILLNCMLTKMCFIVLFKAERNAKYIIKFILPNYSMSATILPVYGGLTVQTYQN